MTADDLRRVDLLSELPRAKLQLLAERMRRERVAAGQHVVAEGQPGDRFYAVLDGTLAVSQDSVGPRRLLSAGDTFGEVALAMRIPRTASVHALTDAVLASCDRDTFDELLRPLFADDSPADCMGTAST